MDKVVDHQSSPNGNANIPCANKFKYLGINFIAKRTLTVDIASIKRKFYVACISVLVRGKYSSEIVSLSNRTVYRF